MPSYYVPEPQPAGDEATPRTGVLLCNLGTPQAPTAAALRSYLAQFLRDRRIIEMSPWCWWPILYGMILPRRPAQSAAKYATVWTDEGSPLLYWSQRQACMLAGWLGEAGCRVEVLAAMRYGQPSIPAQMSALKARGIRRVLVLPAFPQYSATTVGSIFDAVYDWAKRTRHIPELRFVNRCHDHPAYIAALKHRVEEHWQREGGRRADLLVMSFHGIPLAASQAGDPYLQECQTTARLLAAALGLREGQYMMTFQSRFGRAPWLQPYTQPTLESLARKGVKSVEVMCPGFVSDCLETLEEINMEVRKAFLDAGGQAYHYIPCLNDSPPWITALSQVAQSHLWKD